MQALIISKDMAGNAVYWADTNWGNAIGIKGNNQTRVAGGIKDAGMGKIGYSPGKSTVFLSW